jgi:hypothetical protein
MALRREVGRNGQTVNQKWKQGGRSTLGIMMEGFPNLFMTTGPNGPAALANIIRISEHDVDWIAAAITHMQKNGLATMEPTTGGRRQLDGACLQGLAQRSLITKAKTWWVGANVPGKSQGLTMFIGGFAKYREFSAAAAADGYKGFAFERAEEKAEA